MINFKNRAEALPSAILLCAILTLLGTLIFMLVVPMPNAAGVVRGRDRSRRQLLDEIAKTRARIQEAKGEAATHLWTGDHDTVMAQILARMTRQAARNGLQVAAFRPQKQQPVAGMTELPVAVQITGPYPNVLALVRSLDASEMRLAVRSLQIASSDAASNSVAATIGISAYYIDSNAPATGEKGSAPSVTTRTRTGSAAPVPARGGSLG